MKTKKTTSKIESTNTEEKKISRRVAVKKVSRYAAVTTLGTMVLLSPKGAQAASKAPTPGWGG